MPCSKFWKNENGRIELTSVMKHNWYWQDVAQEIIKCHLGLVEALPRLKFWKKKQWNWPDLLRLFEYFDKIMHKHYYWRELDRGIAKCHLSSVEAMPRSKS